MAEPATTTTENKEGVDIAIDAINLLAQGKRNLVCGEIPNAVNQLQEASALLAAKYGETADECGEAYLCYGKSLLDLARMESGVLGNALQGVSEDTEDESADASSTDDKVENPENVPAEEREKISDEVYDAMTELEREKAKKEAEKKKASDGDKETKDEKSEDVEMKDDAKAEKKEDKEKDSEKKEKAKPADEGKDKDKEAKKADEGKDKDKEAKKADEGKDKDKEAKKADEGKDKDKEAKKADEGKDKDKEVKKDKAKEEEKDSEKKTKKGDKAEEKESGKEKEEAMDVEKVAEGKKEGSSEEKEGETEEDEEEEGEEADEGTEEDAGEGTSSGEKKEEEEDVGNLQLAWEMLELAKVIYSRGEAKEQKLKTAECCLHLGEVGLETEQYEQAVGDFTECLKIQKEHLEPENRILAETYYQLGLAYCYSGQYDTSIENYKKAVEVIEAKIAKNIKYIEETEKSGKDPTEPGSFENPVTVARKEVNDLKEILPDIKAKIEDTEEEKKNSERVKQLVKENVASEMSTTTTGFGEASTSASKAEAKPIEVKKATNISHLVRKKRKPDEEAGKEEEDTSKKPRQEEEPSSTTTNGGPAKNGSGDASVNGQQVNGNGKEASPQKKEEIKVKTVEEVKKAGEEKMETAPAETTS